LGACLGTCPEAAIAIESREAEPYDERRVMENIVKQGANVIRAHLKHLADHDEEEYLATAVAVLDEKGIENPLGPGEPDERDESNEAAHVAPMGCPGRLSRRFESESGAAAQAAADDGQRPSALSHWPVQLHLVSPSAAQYQEADVLLAADCTAFALGDFHRDHLQGKALAIACPKLDQGKDVYVEKIAALIDAARINTLTVMIMEVPCCTGLLQLALEAAQQASRKVPIKRKVVGIRGDVLEEEWMRV
jgi:hypothetical protein